MVKRHHGFWTRAMKYLALAAIAVLLVPALLPKRWLYRHGRPNRLARLLNRGWVIAHSAGLWPSRFVTLEVPGRRTGRVVLRHGRREAVRLEEVDPAARPPIVRRYLSVAPGARPHIPVDRHAPVEDFDRIAAQIPVFRVATDQPAHEPGG